MFQNACIGKVAISMYGDRDDLIWQLCSENVSVEYRIKIPDTFI
jgi:hypothetical protein